MGLYSDAKFAVHVTYRSVKPAAFFPRVILIGCNNLVLSNAFPLTAAACLKRCTAARALGPAALNEVVRL